MRSLRFRQPKYTVAYSYGVQDVPSLYFALLHLASAVEECDATAEAICTAAGDKNKSPE